MRIAFLAAAGLLTLAGGCTDYGDRPNSASWRSYNAYDYDRYDPAYGSYDASRYYRDGRLYCRRSDGTTGLIVGAVAGGVLGNIIASGDSEVLGTLIGAGVGAAIGAEVDRGEVRCR